MGCCAGELRQTRSSTPIPVAFDSLPSIRRIANLQQPKMSGLPPPDYTLNEVGPFSVPAAWDSKAPSSPPHLGACSPTLLCCWPPLPPPPRSPPPVACLPKTAQSLPSPPAPPCQAGERVIAASRRPDGTVRKERRVRAGYVPQDEQAVYVSRGAAVSRPGAAAGTSLRSPSMPSLWQQ